jgi:hypothetical protein
MLMYPMHMTLDEYLKSINQITPQTSFALDVIVQELLTMVEKMRLHNMCYGHFHPTKIGYTHFNDGTHKLILFDFSIGSVYTSNTNLEILSLCEGLVQNGPAFEYIRNKWWNTIIGKLSLHQPLAANGQTITPQLLHQHWSQLYEIYKFTRLVVPQQVQNLVDDELSQLFNNIHFQPAQQGISANIVPDAMEIDTE